MDDYYKGMATTIAAAQVACCPGKPTAENIWEALKAHYDGLRPGVCGHELGYGPAHDRRQHHGGQGQLAAHRLRRRRCATTVTALFDNLGKGASGAAVQNMNLMLGFDETAGLAL